MNECYIPLTADQRAKSLDKVRRLFGDDLYVFDSDDRKKLAEVYAEAAHAPWLGEANDAVRHYEGLIAVANYAARFVEATS